MWEYEPDTFDLLATLRESPHLQDYVKVVSFEAASADEGGDFSRVRTSLNSAMITFLDHAPSCVEIVMRNEASEEWAAVRHQKILELSGVPRLNIDILPPGLNLSLTHLTLVDNNGDPLAGWHDKGSVRNLESLVIYRPSPGLLPLLRSASCTLRDLTVPLSSFDSLPFATLTNLTYLSLDADESIYAPAFDESIWGKFSRCPSLADVSFLGRLAESMAELFFGFRQVDPVDCLITKMPTSLRRINFLGEPSLDLLSFILDREQAVVPEIGLATSESRGDRAIDILRLLFEGAGVALIWVPYND